MATFQPGSSWVNTWEDFKASVDAGGTTERTALLLPTSASGENCRVTPGTLFNWHHMAPPIRFEVTTRDPDGGVGRTITITSYVGTDELNYTHENYLYMGPDISFYYENPSVAGDYIHIGTFSRASENDHVSTLNGKQHTIDITDNIETVKICVSCGGCSLDKDFLGYLKLYTHSHISAPSAPTITSTTGKTITVGSGQDGLYCTTNSDGWYSGSSHTFTGLSQGTSYSFKCKKKCPDCPGNKEFESTTVTGKTWSISGSYVNSGAKSITYKATHVAGTNGNADNHSITYKLYTSKSTSGTPVATKTGNNGVPVTFTDLESSKTYYCYAYTTNLGNGDNNCWITSGSTKAEAKVTGSGGDVSAKTLRTSVSWNAGGAKSITCTVTCNGTSRNISSSGGYVGFTGLTPGSSYTASYSIVATYSYTYTYEVKENGRTVTKTGTRDEVITTTGSTSYTTKKSSFGVPVNVTSKIVQFKSLSNYSSDTMQQKINSGEWGNVPQDTYVIYNNLTHNTAHTIYCRIANCFAFDGDGNVTSVNDSELSQVVNTHLLSLSGSISEEHQHSLVTLWQSYVNNIATNSDAIDGTAFEFNSMVTTARKSNPPYQSSEVIEGVNGNTSGDYQLNKKVYSNNLTWYYCEYIVSVSITDGYNTVSNSVTAHTLFPAAWIFNGNQWHRYMGYVFTNGKWVPAPAFVYTNNKFTEPNGE